MDELSDIIEICKNEDGQPYEIEIHTKEIKKESIEIIKDLSILFDMPNWTIEARENRWLTIRFFR